MVIRPETPADAAEIHALVQAAFRDAAHAGGNEAEIVDRLRAGNALAASLVAVDGGEVVGHVAFSAVTLGDKEHWYGLGPLAVRHDRRRRGVAARLVAHGLAVLKAGGANGCVVLGDPGYYGRFGFVCDPAVTLAGVPPGYFQCLWLRGPKPMGLVAYHEAFGAA